MFMANHGSSSSVAAAPPANNPSRPEMPGTSDLERVVRPLITQSNIQTDRSNQMLIKVQWPDGAAQ